MAIVNQSLVKKYFESPIGRHVIIQHRNANFDCEVIGVVADFKHGDVRDKEGPFVFMSYPQWIRADDILCPDGARSAAFSETLTRTVRQVDPNLPVFDLKTLEQQASESLFIERAIALASAFGLLATLLAAIGLYGVMAYSVVRGRARSGSGWLWARAPTMFELW